MLRHTLRSLTAVILCAACLTGCNQLRAMFPAPVPAEVANRSALLSCGIEVRNQRDPANAEMRACLLTAFEARTAAEFSSTRPTVEGDPVTMIYRVWPDDDTSPVVVYTDFTRDAFGSGRWHKLRCQRLEPVADGEDVFGPAGCDEGVTL